jgi:hypothetical protein
MNAAAPQTPPGPRSQIARERRRQIQIRKALEAALQKGGTGAGMGRDFYLAVGDYLVFSMDRLHRQDQLIHDFLGERIPAAETDALEGLAVLNQRQAASRDLMAAFGRALERLRAEGDPGLPSFEAHARDFVATFTSLLMPRKNPFFRHTDRLFTDGDWEQIAGVTPASLREEERLFRAVQSAATPDLDPDRFTAEHLPG